MNRHIRTVWVAGVATTITAAVLPWAPAQAWDHGGHGGWHGHHYGYYGGGYRGGCRGCGAAIVGLAVGTIIGAAITDAARPRVIVEEPVYRQPRRYRRDDTYAERECRSIMVNGEAYHNCGYQMQSREDW